MSAKILRIIKSENKYIVQCLDLNPQGPPSESTVDEFDSLDMAHRRIKDDYPAANPGLHAKDDPDNMVAKYMVMTI